MGLRDGEGPPGKRRSAVAQGTEKRALLRDSGCGADTIALGGRVTVLMALEQKILAGAVISMASDPRRLSRSHPGLWSDGRTRNVLYPPRIGSWQVATPRYSVLRLRLGSPASRRPPQHAVVSLRRICPSKTDTIAIRLIEVSGGTCKGPVKPAATCLGDS
jgi:hypothetical protein